MNFVNSIDRVPLWASQYIGIPFLERGRDKEGCDCWGLYRLILLEQCGIDLPSYGEAYQHATDGERVGSAISLNGTETEDWILIAEGTERLGDAILMSGLYKINGRWHKANMHVGFILLPGLMLHVEQGIDAALGYYRTDRRLKPRVQGIYRYTAMEKAQ